MVHSYREYFADSAGYTGCGREEMSDLSGFSRGLGVWKLFIGIDKRKKRQEIVQMYVPVSRVPDTDDAFKLIAYRYFFDFLRRAGIVKKVINE